MLSCFDISLLGRFSLFHSGFASTCQPKRKFTDAVAENQAQPCLCCSELVWRPERGTKGFQIVYRSRSRVLVDVSGTNKHRINIPVWWNLEGFFFFEVQFWILYQVIIQTTHSPQVTVDPRSSGLSFAFFLFFIQSKPPPVFYSRKFKNLTLTQMSGLGGKASRWMEKNCYAVITVQESEIKVLSLE